ncbi:MAG: histidinol dehydrogenase [Planctomycetota bacterium]|nr:histidinol dehydrogenase [Planctomycetota bacterium]
MVKIRRLAELNAAELRVLMQRAESNIEQVAGTVSKMIAEIRTHGDAAVLDYAQQFDHGGDTFASLKVTDAEIEAAQDKVAPEVVDAIELACENVETFHRKQLPKEMWFHEIRPGVFAGERHTPVASAGLYVPGGKGTFPSVMVMLGVPATVAKVPRIAVVTPPNEHGEVDPGTLYIARKCGIREIYKMGGAHAVAALGLGTQSIPKVDKIIGPGSIYASAAKRLLYGTVDVGLPAGPSESIILCDETTDPEIAALDLLIEAEHGPDSAAILVTHVEEVAMRAAEHIPKFVAKLPKWRREFVEQVLENYGGILITPSLDASFDFVNDYAPEHMELQVDDAFRYIGRIQNAGEVLLGPYTPISIANYCLGVNAILPTGAFAKSFSSVTIDDFIKKTSIAYLNREGYERLKGATEALANHEGFPAHALAISERDAILNR